MDVGTPLELQRLKITQLWPLLREKSNPCLTAKQLPAIRETYVPCLTFKVPAWFHIEAALSEPKEVMDSTPRFLAFKPRLRHFIVNFLTSVLQCPICKMGMLTAPSLWAGVRHRWVDLCEVFLSCLPQT